MGASSRIATQLDAEMLGLATSIAPPGTSYEDLQPVIGLSTELGGRYLLRYVLTSQLGQLTSGTTRTQYVTPTPYAPEETISWLALPPASGAREWVLVLDPAALSDVRGPRWVRLGGGIEYVLPTGFPSNAVVAVGAPPTGGAWELQIQ